MTGFPFGMNQPFVEEKKMSFSDDDLKRLKEQHIMCGPGDHGIGLCKGCALIARLEAAEDYIKGAKYKCVECGELGVLSDDSEHLRKAWLKAAGK